MSRTIDEYDCTTIWDMETDDYRITIPSFIPQNQAMDKFRYLIDSDSFKINAYC